MTWKCVRLELARTPDFPNGSASRSYLLRLPLGADGLIDTGAVAASPDQATVRRYWPNQPDMLGYVVPTSRGWAFSYEQGEDGDERLFDLETHPIRVGEHVMLTELDGRDLPFRVADIRAPN